MTFYTLDYLKAQHQVDQAVLYGVGVVVLLILTLTLLAYAKNRLKTKYRDLSIIMVLIMLYLFGLNYNSFEQHKSQTLSSSQIQPFLRSVAKETRVPQAKVSVNSRTLADGIIVKVADKYYRVSLSPDRSSYNLERTHMIDQNIKVQ
ncbi:DUF3290 domain-containing protein [Ligilactobacillus faecis]|uniref:DUF3290 domain-containing protein n=1 Tax=Ligilactobacillus faecis TaxID=762833 RepID=UPI00246880FC|nr:DUF3290 domain-containing protein [Ligilactobacillus faecis]WGN90232.1 DUF3290 domain-containing protein [Ligilactobacillus faecis]